MQDLRDLAEHFRKDSGAFGMNEWGLSPSAVMESWVVQESRWDPYAVREEPGFYRRYVLPNLTTSRAKREQWQLATSWGLLQVMGQTAREMGFSGKYIPQLLDPSLSLYFGCKYLMHQKKRGDGEWAQALAAYNGGIGGTPDNRTRPYRNQYYVDEIIERARG